MYFEKMSATLHAVAERPIAKLEVAIFVSAVTHPLLFDRIPFTLNKLLWPTWTAGAGSVLLRKITIYPVEECWSRCGYGMCHL